MFDYKLSEKSANDIYDILVEHMGAEDGRFWRGEFLERFVNKEIPQEFWFTGIGGTGWKMWFDSYTGAFTVRHETGQIIPARQANVDTANAALVGQWEFLAA